MGWKDFQPVALTTENCQKYFVFVQPPKSDTFFGKKCCTNKIVKKVHIKSFSNMYNTYRFETKVWQLLCGRDGEKKKIGFVNKNRSRQKNQKVPQIFFRSSPYSDSFGPIWVVRSYSNMEVIEKKIKGTFWFF